MTDTEIRNPASAYFKWKMPVIVKSEDDWNFWNTEDKYNRTMFIGYNDLTTPHVASLFIIVDGKAMQAVGDDIIARIAQQEKDISEALTDIQTLIDRVNEQQMSIEQLKAECQLVLGTAQDYVRDAQTWAEGSDEAVSEKGGEHSAKGWAQKANDIVASGLPSDASFEHITVTGSSKFGQDPDRENQPGLEIEGTGEIQAYRTVNMHNGGTIEYDGTVEMPWSDSSNKIPNTEWVQKAVRHGSIDPNTELTVNSITATAGGANLTARLSEYDAATLAVSADGVSNIQLGATRYRPTTDGKVIDSQGRVQVTSEKVWMEATAGMEFTADTRGLGNDAAFKFNKPSNSTRSANFYVMMPALLQGGLSVGVANGVGLALNIWQERAGNPFQAKFYVTPTVPDIADAADSSDKVPNTKWVQAAITAGGSSGGAVSSVNGKTGEVVLAASDVGAATAGDITTALEPYAKTADVTSEISTATAGLQPKLTAGANITISEDNVISATGGAVDSVNGKTGKVVLNATDVGAITGAEADTKITTALEPYAKTADVTADIAAAVAPLATTEALTTGLEGKQDVLKAGNGIIITNDNTIAALSDVTSVNGKTGAVVLTAENITMGPSDTTTVKENSDAISALVTGKQDALTPASDIAVNFVQAEALSVMERSTADLKLSANTSSFLAYQGYIQLGKDENASGTMNGTWSINNANVTGFLTGSQATMDKGTFGQLLGGSNQSGTGEFNWYMNTTTDYNKFNVYNRYWETTTDADTGESTTTAVDSLVMSAGGSPDNHSTWIDFTANYLSFKGAANFGETGMASHTMNFNGVSTFNARATFNEDVTLSINEYGEYKDGIMWMPRKNANTFGLTAQAPIYIDGWDTTKYTNNLVKLRGCGLAMMDSTGTNTFLKLVTNNTIGQMQVNGSMFVTGANNLLHIRQGAGLVVQDANLNVLIDTTVAGQVNMDNNVRLGSTAHDVTDDSGNVTEHVDATNVWVNGAALFYTGLTCMPGAPAAFSGDVEFYKVDSEGGALSAVSFSALTGVLDVTAIKATDGSDGSTKLAWDADSRNTDTYGMHINMPVTVSDASFKRTSTLAADDNSTEVPTTAWVTAAIAASGSSVPDNITCKTLKVTNWDGELDSIEFAGNLKYSGDYGNGSLGKITAQEFFANSSGYYSSRVKTSGISLTSGASADVWFNADSSAKTLTINGKLNSSTPAASANNTEVATTAWVNTAITAKAATKPTLTYAEKTGEPTVTKIEQCDSGSLCTIMWKGQANTATGHVYIDVPSDFASAKIVSIQFTPHDTATAAPWSANASLTAGKIMLSFASTQTSANVSAIIVLYKA